MTQAMRDRCNNPNNHAYQRYGAPEQAVSHPPCHGKRPFKAHTEFGIALTVPPDRFAYSPREEKAA